MKKRILAMFLMTALLVTLLSACGSKDSSGSNDSGSAGKKYDLSFTIHDPATSAKVAKYQELCDQVYEQTDGAVKITIYPGGTLAAGTDAAEAVLKGTADMGWIFTTFFPGQFPLTDIATLPMMYEDNIQATTLLLDLYEQSEDLQKELSNYKVLGMSCNPINFIYTKDKPVNSMADMRGLNMRATAGVATDMVKGWGGSPALMGPGDMYEALNKGVLDGFMFEWSGFNSFNLYEVINYCTELSTFCGPFLVLMNKNTWNELPAEYQEVIDNVWNREASLAVAQVFADDAATGRAKAIEEGVEIIALDEASAAEFQHVADNYVDQWVTDNNAQDYYDLATTLLK